ncbi:hypothetical protein DYY66_1874 [Candidatus Nitrosotalea sp. FS]|nr:hypothetical protein [Candidatus Nitrosotalea sp. FS]
MKWGNTILWNVQNAARQWINPSKNQRQSTHVFAAIIKSPSKTS